MIRANAITSASLSPMFWRHVQKTASCWIWKAATVGHMKYGATRRGLAHRLVYAAMVAPIPAGMLVCHRCDNPRCVNPEHLFLATPLENMQDMIAKGRDRKAPAVTHCKRGHSFDEQNTYRKNGRRMCKECRRVALRESRARKAQR